jgi:phage terminase large subunit-like protein
VALVTTYRPPTWRPPELLTDRELYRRSRALIAELKRREYDWERHARPDQLEPAEPYDVWAIIAGRGWGKTRTGAETVKKWSRARQAAGLGPGHYAVIAKTHREVQAICYEARSAGLLAVFEPGTFSYKKSPALLITLDDGTMIRAFSAEDPDAIRGYAFDGAWCDEYAAWPRKVAQDMFDQLWFCLREATDPRVIVTTTPKNLPHVRDLVNGPEGMRVHVTRGHTADNLANLSPAAVAVLQARYEGTRLGRQELHGELLTDVEGAMLQQAWIDDGRLRSDAVPRLQVKAIGVDPAKTSGEVSDLTGIITVGLDGDVHAYVLNDLSGRYTPEEWAEVVWQEAIDQDVDVVIVEDNVGGEMVESILKAAWIRIVEHQRRIGNPAPARPPIVRVTPSGPNQSKWLRAQTIALLYEQKPPRVHHVLPVIPMVDDGTGRLVPDSSHPLAQPGAILNPLEELEDEATTWTGDKDEPSPDRVDAMVHALRWLMFPANRSKKSQERRPTGPSSQRWSGGGRTR